MTYDELIEVLGGMEGRMVEVSIRTPYEDEKSGSGGRWFASFSGIAGQLGQPQTAGGDHRTLYWQREDPRTKPTEGSVTVWRKDFEGAEVKGSGRTLEEVQAEEIDDEGAVWEVWIYQGGLLTELMVFVWS